jgi:hypothetical protein
VNPITITRATIVPDFSHTENEAQVSFNDRDGNERTLYITLEERENQAVPGAKAGLTMIVVRNKPTMYAEDLKERTEATEDERAEMSTRERRQDGWPAYLITFRQGGKVTTWTRFYATPQAAVVDAVELMQKEFPDGKGGTTADLMGVHPERADICEGCGKQVEPPAIRWCAACRGADNEVACPRNDPSCTSGDDENHDACEAPKPGTMYVVHFKTRHEEGLATVHASEDNADDEADSMANKWAAEDAQHKDVEATAAELEDYWTETCDRGSYCRSGGDECIWVEPVDAGEDLLVVMASAEDKPEPPNITENGIEWAPNGHFATGLDPYSRLLATLATCPVFAGTQMHLEAIEVGDNDELEQVAVNPQLRDELDHLQSVNNNTFQTTRIGGREYVVYALPHGA